MRLTAEKQKLVEELLPLALHIARVHGRVEDAASVALLTLCKAVAKYPGPPVPLKVYAASRVRRDVRGRRRRRKKPLAIGACEFVVSRPEGDELSVPQKLAGVFDLHYRQGFSQEETAERLGLSLRTVERRANAIRRALRGGSQ